MNDRLSHVLTLFKGVAADEKPRSTLPLWSDGLVRVSISYMLNHVTYFILVSTDYLIVVKLRGRE